MKQNPRKKKIGWLPKLVLVALCIYTCTVLLMLQTKITAAEQKVENLGRSVEIQKQENELARANDADVLTDEIIADFLQDKLGYEYPGTVTFRFDDDK